MLKECNVFTHDRTLCVDVCKLKEFIVGWMSYDPFNIDTNVYKSLYTVWWIGFKCW